jgi:hypothetical protein
MACFLIGVSACVFQYIPMRLFISTSHSFTTLTPADLTSLIVKTGDDMLQEQFAMQLLSQIQVRHCALVPSVFFFFSLSLSFIL